MKILLHKSQGIVFRSTSRFKVIAAGRRFGKTVLACVILFYHALKNPGIYWYVAPTYGQAKELAWDILIRMIPKELLEKQPNETELKFTLKNGATIHLKGADNAKTLVGRGLKGLVIDEVAKIKNRKQVWEQILRPALSDYLGFCIFISTPQGKDYFWELFIKGQRKEDGFESWQFKTADNPYIPRSEIKAAQAVMNDRVFRQEYEASFEDFTGLIWPEFNYDLHTADEIKLEKWYETISCIDPAITGTTAALNAWIDEKNKILIPHEYYEQNKRVSEVSASLKLWRSDRWLIDPASKSQKVQKEGEIFSLFDEYGDNGIFAQAAENDVNAGINRVAEYFKAGKILISRSCKNLIYEIERYHWSEERETVLGVSEPKPFKSLDHACDVLRYIVMSRASGGKEPPVKSKDPAAPFAGELINRAAKNPWQKWNQ